MRAALTDVLLPSFFPFGLAQWPVAVLLVVNLAVLVVAIIYIPRTRRPTTALAWLLTIFLIPYLGVALFFLFGTNRLSRKRRDMQARADTIIRDAIERVDTTSLRVLDVDRDGLPPGAPETMRQVFRLNRNLTAIPSTPGNRLELFSSYNRTIRIMADEIDTAETYVHALFYAMSMDDATAPFFDALDRAVRRGVVVRVLFDHIGSRRYPGYNAMKRRLREIGCEWRPMLPIWPWAWVGNGYQRIDLRNHRKLLVVDGRTAFMGSQNMIDRGYHKGGDLKWKDLVVRIEGPTVAGVDAIFFTDWFGETGQFIADDYDAIGSWPQPVAGGDTTQVVPSGPGYEEENNLRLFNQLMYGATERVTIVSPYFVPDDSLLYAITTAVQRGVEVELFAGEIGDQFFVYHAQRSYYEILLKAGVRIWLYRKPFILHSKHITFDDDVALIGSSNLDQRSFTLNAEMMLMVYGADFVRRLREVENGYRQRSFELTLELWKQEPWLGRAFDSLARLTSAVQ